MFDNTKMLVDNYAELLGDTSMTQAVFLITFVIKEDSENCQ